MLQKWRLNFKWRFVVENGSAHKMETQRYFIVNLLN